MIRSIMIMLCAVALTACGTTGPLHSASQAVAVATSPTPMGDRIIMDEKAMYAAELLYNVPAQAYVSADTRGLVSPSIRATIRPRLITLATYLKLVRQAYAIGDATSFAQRYRELKQLSEAVRPLIPGNTEGN